jgi:hypothetical protein
MMEFMKQEMPRFFNPVSPRPFKIKYIIREAMCMHGGGEQIFKKCSTQVTARRNAHREIEKN